MQPVTPLHTLNTLPAAHVAEMAGAVPVRSFSLRHAYENAAHDDCPIELLLQLDARTVARTVFFGPDALLRARGAGIRYNETGDTAPDTRSRRYVARLPSPAEEVFASAVEPSGAVLPFPSAAARGFRFIDLPDRMDGGMLPAPPLFDLGHALADAAAAARNLLQRVRGAWAGRQQRREVRSLIVRRAPLRFSQDRRAW